MVNRRSHQTDIILKIYADGFRIKCQCGEYDETIDNLGISSALKRMHDHTLLCKRVVGEK